MNEQMLCNYSEYHCFHFSIDNELNIIGELKQRNEDGEEYWDEKFQTII